MLKVDPAVLAKDLKERDELRTFKAAEDVKALSRPQKADDYKLDLPADFKRAAGEADFKFDANDPLIVQVRAWAHATGKTQEDFSQMLGFYAADKAGEQARIDAAAAAQVAKLGTNGPALVDASTRWLDSVGMPSWKQMMVTAQQVTELQNYIAKSTSQGAAGFSTQHRVPADDGKIPNYSGMSFEQRRFAQDQRNARKTG